VKPDEDHVRCRYCGTQVLIPGRRKPAPPPTPQVQATTVVIGRDVVNRGAQNAAKQVTSGCLIAVIAIVVIVTLGGALLFPLLRTTETLITEVSIDTPVLEIPAVFSAPTTVIGAAWTIPAGENGPALALLKRWEGEKVQLIAFDPAAQAEVWRSGTFNREYYEMSYSSGPSTIYIADQDRLIALDRGTGEVTWQASLANKVQYPCEAFGCVQRFGDRVVTLARDGSLQGFDAANGALVWTRRLTSTPRWMEDAAGRLLIVDNDEANRAIVLVLDPASGDALLEFEPACMRNGRPDRIHINEKFLLAPDGESLTVLDSGIDACAWRYDLRSGAMMWEYAPESSTSLLPFTWSTSSAVLAADGSAYFTVDQGDATLIVRLDGATGAAQTLLQENRYDVELQSGRDGLLLAVAAPDFDREQRELWAIDTGTGERRWTYRFRTGHAFDKIYLRHVDGGLFVGQCLWEDNSCVFEILNTQTGASSGQANTLDIRSPSGDGAWVGDLLLLTISGKLYGVDGASGTTRFTWP
jgi:outer membrane protein assembly factor BamB